MNKKKDAMDKFDRGVATMLMSCELGEKKFIVDVLKKIDDSKSQWQYFGELISRNQKNSDERIEYLDQNITKELSDFFKSKVVNPFETLFVLEKFRFTSYMALIAMLRKIKDDKEGEKKWLHGELKK